jgi:hypothetical protein
MNVLQLTSAWGATLLPVHNATIDFNFFKATCMVGIAVGSLTI